LRILSPQRADLEAQAVSRLLLFPQQAHLSYTWLHDLPHAASPFYHHHCLITLLCILSLTCDFPIADGRIQAEVGNLGEGDLGMVVERVRWEVSRCGTVLVWTLGFVVVVGLGVGLVLGVGLPLFQQLHEAALVAT
jgi:hypothetical protein